MPVTAAEVNSRDLVRRYLDGSTRARRGERFLQAAVKSGRDLSDLLRYHRPRGFEDQEEIARRDELDFLLAFAARLEIAALAGFVPDPLPDELQRRLLPVLEHADVRRYYELHYPLLLPQLLRRRLRGEWRGDAHDAPAHVFASFLDLNASIEGDDDVETVLWFLDDGQLQDAQGQYVGLPHLVAILSDPEGVGRRLGRRRGRDVLDRALGGLREYLVFCSAFDALLQGAREWPLLQSALWHYHGYWFRIIGEGVGRGLAEAIGRFQGWSADAEPTASSRSLDRIGEQVKRLTSGAYGQPLDEAASA